MLPSEPGKCCTAKFRLGRLGVGTYRLARRVPAHATHPAHARITAWITNPAGSPLISALKVNTVAAANGRVVRMMARGAGKCAERTQIQASAPTSATATPIKPKNGPAPLRLKTRAVPYAAPGRATAATPITPARITESMLMGLTRRSSATAGGSERGLKWNCFHRVKWRIRAATG
jgi:hypothetical protein